MRNCMNEEYVCFCRYSIFNQIRCDHPHLPGRPGGQMSEAFLYTVPYCFIRKSGFGLWTSISSEQSSLCSAFIFSFITMYSSRFRPALLFLCGLGSPRSSDTSPFSLNHLKAAQMRPAKTSQGAFCFKTLCCYLFLL